MKKMTSRDRRAEERRILAEMDEAMAKQKPAEQPQTTTPTKKKARSINHYDDSMPQKVHCKRCKTLMENGVCPACGFTVYVPMSEEKRNKIKLTLTVVAFVVFIVIFVALQFKKG